MSEPDLPDDIIRHIITKHLLCDPTLTNKKAVRLSLVSKEFSRAVQRRPTLIFEWDNHKRSKTKCLQELKYMISALNQDLETLTIRATPGSSSSRIRTSIYDDDYSCFDQCIKLAAANNRGLRNLNLQLWDTYVVPQPIFKVESLVRLDLQHCRIPTVDNVITWPNLKRLCLDSLIIKDEVFENIIRGCSAVEILKILDCRFSKSTFHINVSNLFFLKQFEISLTGYQTLEVDAVPNLECLVYRHTIDYMLQADLGKYEYRKLRSLTVSNTKAFIHNFLTNIEHQFPQLEELCIQYTNLGINRISVSSSSLKKISFVFVDGLEEATFNVPNILVFDFYGYGVPKLSFTGNPNGWNSRVVIIIDNANIDTSLFLKVKQLLDAYAISSTSITVFLHIAGAIEFHISSHSRMSADLAISIPVTIEEFIICSLRFPPIFCLSLVSEMLDGIFLICGPQKIKIMDVNDYCELSKVVYDNLLRSKRFYNHQLMWNLTRIDVHKKEHRTLLPPQIFDRDKFLDLFNVIDDDVGWKRTIYVHFELEYFMEFSSDD